VNPISLASGVVPEFGPLDTIRAAAAGGFDAVGLWIEPVNWNPTLMREAKRALADTNLRLLDVEVVWIKPDSNMDEHRRCLDIGIELGAENVLCVSSDPDMGATVTRLGDLCRHAEGSGLRVALEFGIFTAVKTISAARHILDEVGHPLRALLVDPIHVDRSGATPADIAAVPRSLLPYAQFCDAPGSGRFQRDHRGRRRPATTVGGGGVATSRDVACSAERGSAGDRASFEGIARTVFRSLRSRPGVRASDARLAQRKLLSVIQFPARQRLGIVRRPLISICPHSQPAAQALRIFIHGQVVQE